MGRFVELRAGRAVGRITRRCALAAIGAGLGAISVSASGADLETGYTRAVAFPSHSARAARRSIPAHPVNPVDAPSNRPVARGELVDPLYDELMHSSGCALTSLSAFIRGGC